MNWFNFSIKSIALSLLASLATPLIAQPVKPWFSDDFATTILPKKLPFGVVEDVTGTERRVHTPSLMEAKPGTILCAWLNYGLWDMDESNTVRVKRSRDGGKTWQSVHEVKGYSINPTFLRSPKGDAWLFFNRKNADVQDDNDLWETHSTDDGTTWTEPRKLDVGYQSVIMVNNGLVLKNGDWLITFHYDVSTPPGQKFDNSRSAWLAGVAISQDEGKTWKQYGGIRVPNYANLTNRNEFAVEPAVVEYAPGQLAIFIRTRSGRIYRATSADSGHTWSEATPMTFSNADHKIAAVTTAAGQTVLFWDNNQVFDHATLRTPMLVSISDDGGATFRNTLTVCDDPVPLVYPAVIEMPRGNLRYVYGHGLKQIRFGELKPADFRSNYTLVDAKGQWLTRDGVVTLGDDQPLNSAYDWANWAKLCLLKPGKPAQNITEVDFQFETNPSFNRYKAAAGVFYDYQDEDNWTAFVWRPGQGEIGLQREARFGYSEGITQDKKSSFGGSQEFLKTLKPASNTWYRVRIRQTPWLVTWEVYERESGKLLLSDSQPLPPLGNFTALGGRNVRVSFDNLKITPGAGVVTPTTTGAVSNR